MVPLLPPEEGRKSWLNCNRLVIHKHKTATSILANSLSGGSSHFAYSHFAYSQGGREGGKELPLTSQTPLAPHCLKRREEEVA